MNAHSSAICSLGYDGASTYYTGYIDEVCVTKGKARYLNTFTPQGGPFPVTTLTFVTDDGSVHTLGLNW